MFKNPIELGNYLLILLGIVLLVSGPLIIYRTAISIAKAKAAMDSGKKATIVDHFNNGLNYLIGLMFFIAGILFILNNLRGNPLLAF